MCDDFFFIRSMSRYLFGNLSETLYSLLFVRIRFNDVYVPPLCRVQTTTFNVFTHGPWGLLSVYRGQLSSVIV